MQEATTIDRRLDAFPRSNRSGVATAVSSACRQTHAMRNELVEELIVEGEAKVLQNRTGRPKDSAKLARGRAKQAAERKK
jgi:hypothetical protein